MPLIELEGGGGGDTMPCAASRIAIVDDGTSPLCRVERILRRPVRSALHSDSPIGRHLAALVQTVAQPSCVRRKSKRWNDSPRRALFQTKGQSHPCAAGSRIPFDDWSRSTWLGCTRRPGTAPAASFGFTFFFGFQLSDLYMVSVQKLDKLLLPATGRHVFCRFKSHPL